jgi:hypothetical protein
MILTVEKYTAGGDDYRIYGSAAITVGGSSPRRKVLYAEMQSTHSNASLYISDFVDKLVSGQNIKCHCEAPTGLWQSQPIIQWSVVSGQWLVVRMVGYGIYDVPKRTGVFVIENVR